MYSLGRRGHHDSESLIATAAIQSCVLAGFGLWKIFKQARPSLKLTYPLKIGLPERKVVFQPSIFRGELLVSGRVNGGIWDADVPSH